MLTCSIDPRLFARFPALTFGAFLASGVDRAAVAFTSEDLEAAWKLTTAALALAQVTPATVARLDAVAAWRGAFTACGVPGNQYPSAVEANVHRVLRDGAVRSLPSVMALCRALSARHLVPLRGYDLAAIPGSTITLRTARPDSDWFVPLAARPSDLPLTREVVVYAAGRTVLAWLFNQCDSRQVCLGTDTRSAVFISEAVAADQADATSWALIELRRRLAKRGAQVGAVKFARAAAPEFKLSITQAPAKHAASHSGGTRYTT